MLPGGHHRSAQHDAELQGVALRWLDGRCGPTTHGADSRRARAGDVADMVAEVRAADRAAHVVERALDGAVDGVGDAALASPG